MSHRKSNERHVATVLILIQGRDVEGALEIETCKDIIVANALFYRDNPFDAGCCMREFFWLSPIAMEIDIRKLLHFFTSDDVTFDLRVRNLRYVDETGRQVLRVLNKICKPII